MTLIQLYEIDGGQAIAQKVTTIENLLTNGNFTVSEMNAKQGVIQNNLMVGYTDNNEISDNLIMEVSGNTLFHSQVQILGTTIFGKETTNAEEVSNNDTNLLVYGDLKIMDGGNIIIEDVCNTTITDLRTEVKITDSLDISNDGTSVAMTVRQIDTDVQDIAHFIDSDDVVFTIGSGGKTFIGGDVSMESSLEISNNLLVHNEVFVDKDVSFGSHLQVVGDVSMESSLEISNNLLVHTNLLIDGDASFGSHLQVVGDVSMVSSLEISNNLLVHTNLLVDGDVSLGENLTVVGDVFINSVLDVCGTVTTNKNFIFETNSTEKMLIDTSGVKLLNSDPSYSALDISATSALKIPVGYQSQRPTVETTGQIRYNKSTKQFEGYGDTGNWQGLGGIIDVDQDTFILAETQPDEDNDQIQIFTDSAERMRIDACGNIQMMNSDPSYSALDISATSALKIPVGYQSQRPTVEITGQIRYNKSTKQFEGYGDTGGWQGLGGITDLDQDTYIVAHDNNEIQIFTASAERMKVDACGNIQMLDSNSNYSALDVSATSSISIPRGTIDERPETNSNAPRSLRFNSDTSLCEVYTESNIWSGIPIYKAEQPPPLLEISQVRLSETVTVNWNKFADIYKDAFDGKCYPIYLQTFVDISFTDISGTSSSGWKTIYIGPGNYDASGDITIPLTTFTFNSVSQTSYSNATGYTIPFPDKPGTINLPVFTQEDLFDLRVYGVNRSETSPNFIDISNVQLKQTGPPGAVQVINFESFGKTEFVIDLSFSLDGNDKDISDGISITNYDVSFTLFETKSLKSRIHTENQYTNWNSPSSLSKDDIDVSGLFPGAQYNIQVRAQNALKLDPSSNTGYMYGDYGDVSTSTGFTQISSNQYIDTGDLDSVTPGHMTFTLNKTKSIYGYTSGGTKLSNKTITNENGYIQFSNTSEFYVNYAKQGIDMSGENSLVQATVELSAGSNSYSRTITYDGTNDPSGVSAESIDISNGSESASLNYQFTSGGAYTDKAKTTSDDSTIGFVYSSTFDNSNNTTEASLNEIFIQNFPASTDSYELTYTITGTKLNGSSNSASNTTGSFYVDDYNSTPDISWNIDPYLTVNSSSSLFGIPSVLSIRLQGSFDVSGFASYIIPHSNDTSYIHSYVSAMSDTGYSFSQVSQKDIKSTNPYTFNGNTTYNQTDDIDSDTYNASPSITFTANVYYLGRNSSGIPTLETKSESKNVTMDSIFRDDTTTYSEGYDLYSFDSVNSVLGSQITTDFTASSLPSDISHILLYFDKKFVSSGYYVTTDGNNVYPFSDWSDGYAVTGPDYDSYIDTGSVGGDGNTKFKWIVLDVTNDVSGSELNLTNFKIQNQLFTSKTFGTDYEAYVMDENNKIGSLKDQTYQTGAAGGSTWFEFNNYTIADANSQANGLRIGSSSNPAAYVSPININSQKLYLIIGLPPNSSSINYFTYSS